LGERLLQTEKNGARTTVLAPLCLQSVGVCQKAGSFLFVRNKEPALANSLLHFESFCRFFFIYFLT